MTAAAELPSSDARDSAPGADPSATDERSELLELEWPRVVAALAARAVGPLRERPLVPIHGTRREAEAALDRTREVLALTAGGEDLPIAVYPDVRRHLQRLERAGDLDGPGLRELVDLMAMGRVLRLFLGRHREATPALRGRLELSVALDDLEDTLAGALEQDGAVSPHASAELARLSTEVANLRGRLVRRLEGLLEKRGELLQERYYTEREGRYVLPVRADAHERVHGIVHGTSQSGQTLFIEPRELVEQGNRLKMARAEKEREETRILSTLSATAREHLPDLSALVDSLEEADRRRAAASLARDLGGFVPRLDDADVLSLARARHPLLVLDGAAVVANDLEVGASRALVLSGPNAGGKTVAMKTLGLAALMARAGLPVAAGDESRVGFFAHVATDLGDHQSTRQNLSTFSAHVSHVGRILRAASPGSLVLLDELAGGTDPEEGASLACAIVAALVERGAAAVVTTHYPALKALAATDDRLTNAAVSFDVERMLPTFRIEHGVPGTSCALPVARRFGIEDGVIERAEAQLPPLHGASERLAAELVRHRDEAREDRERAAELRRAAERDADAVEAERARHAERIAREQTRAREELRRTVRELRRELKDVRREIRAARDEEAARVAAERLQDAARRVPEPPPSVQQAPGATAATAQGAVPAEDVRSGLMVWVPELRRDAVVVELGKKGRVRVAAGSLKCWVDVAGLRHATAPREERAEPPRSRPRAAQELSPRGDANSLDLRGMRVDDALTLVDTFLDRLYGEGASAAYLLHGHGTGALRLALREHLDRGLPTVKAYRPGEPREGGDALTVVSLR